MRNREPAHQYETPGALTQRAHHLPRTPRSFGWLGLEIGVLIAVLVATWYLVVGVWQFISLDVEEYYRYAHAFWFSHPRFHMLPIEYPPLAIAPFSLTLIPPVHDHYIVFGCWMGLLVILCYLAFRRFSGQRNAVAFVAYLLLGTGAFFLGRFDLVPALATVAALFAVERRQFRLAYGLIALGILLKLYPAFLLPIVLIAQWQTLSHTSTAPITEPPIPPRDRLARILRSPAVRQIARDLSIPLTLVVLGFALSYALSPAGTLSEFRYASQRPLQVESLPASLLWLGTFLGFPAHSVFSFGSWNYLGPLDAVLKPLSALALAGGCIFVYWRQMRTRLTMGQAFLACLCVVIATNKIFSAQYLIWVIPFVALAEGFDLVWLAICLLTTLEYPILYQQTYQHWAVAFNLRYLVVLALRNGLIVYATLRAVLRRPNAALVGEVVAEQPLQRHDSTPASVQSS